MAEQISVTPDPAEQLEDDLEILAQLEEAQREALKAAQEAAQARLAHLGEKLQREADDRVRLRSDLEDRWLKAVRLLNGKYEPSELPPKQDALQFGSELNIPLTRRLRNMIVARLVDILFQSDERFFTVEPSPLAELADAKAAAKGLPADAQVASVPGAQLSTIMQAIEGVQKEAELRASRMQRTIDDRFAECGFAAKARRAIEDAVDFGTGVIKGPVPKRVRRRVRLEEGGQSRTVIRDEVVQAYEHVPLWNFFPDLSATDIQESTSEYELHPMTDKALRDLRGQPGFIDAAIDQILKGDPREEAAGRRRALREISNLSAAKDERYAVWEYHGPLSGEDLICCGETDVDPKEQYQAVVWFCEGVVIKAIVQPLSSNSPKIYSLIYWQRDRSSIFAFGLPDEVRDPAAAANASWRALMDNLALTAGPMIGFDNDVVYPFDGRKEIRPRKVWIKKDPTKRLSDAFEVFQIPSNINDLLAAFNASKSIMDEIATVPVFGAGAEQPTQVQSATQASIAYNSSTMWVRRFVRHWDDELVTPVVTRAIDWEMDFNPDDDIKGDLRPVARGMSGLVELEGQGNRMQQFVQLVGQMGIPLKDQYRIARGFARSLKLDADEILPSQEEIEAMQGDQGPSLEERKVAVAEENNRMDHQAKMAELQGKEADRALRAEEYARRERLALLELASHERLTVEQTAQKYGYDWQRLQAELADSERQREHESQIFNAEAALKVRAGSGL